WKMNPIVSRRTRVRPSSVRLPRISPSTRTWPAVGRSRPPTRLSSVDLPDPDGPMIETISPRGIDRGTSSGARTGRWPSNCLETRSSSIIGVSIMTAAGGRLDPSGAAEADGDGPVVAENHRDGAAAGGVAEHAFELRRLLLDVDVFDIDVPPLIV